MPLVHIHLNRGRDAAGLRGIADAVHHAVLGAFSVPERDRYQLIHQHDADEMVVQDTGLGFERSREVVVVQVVSRARTRAEKQDLYARLQANLERDCGIAPTDLVVTAIDNADCDWSFGLGRAQFVTGELT